MSREVRCNAVCDLGSCVPTANMATDVAQTSQPGHGHRVSQGFSRLFRQRL